MVGEAGNLFDISFFCLDFVRRLRKRRLTFLRVPHLVAVLFRVHYSGYNFVELCQRQRRSNLKRRLFLRRTSSVFGFVPFGVPG